MSRPTRLLPEARQEFLALNEKDQTAVAQAIDKLQLYGEHLGAPHSSKVLGSHPPLWELRPTSGRNPWRVLYRRIGDEMVLAAIGKDAEIDRRGFARAVSQAQQRLARSAGEP
jgi:hypothetical protein